MISHEFFKRGISIILFLSVFVQGGVLHCRESGYEYGVPLQLNDGWEVASLSEVGLDTAAIEGITEEIGSDDRFDRIHSMLIVKNGKLVHEAYFWGYQRNSPNVLASITKTVTSTLIGIAIDKGYIKSEDESVLSLIPDYAGKVKDPKLKEIKLKHLLSMSSGLDWFEHGSSYNDTRNDEWRMVDSEDWMAYVLGKSLRDAPGTKFLYNTGGMHLVSAVIRNSTGLNTNLFAEKHLFEPLGIYAYQWNRDSTGHPCTGGTDGGLGLRTRDLAKFGWLFLHDGKWKGRQVISERWIKEATRGHMKMTHGRYYGYNWFPGTMERKGKKADYILTSGYGGQTLYLIPEFDAIVAFTCELTDRNTRVSIPIDKVLDVIFSD